MKSLQRPPEVKGILSFDFDGTLHLPEHTPSLNPTFFETIQSLRSEGWLWAINTGRSLLHMLEGFQESSFPFAPDYLIAREREIYTPGDHFGRWYKLKKWDTQYKKDTALFLEQSSHFIDQIKTYVLTTTKAQWIEEEGDPAGVITTSEKETDQIVTYVEEHRHQAPLLGYLRNTIYMRFTHKSYHKGSSLSEIARLENVATSHIFAIGDSHNDLDKLNPTRAGMIACVGNAQENVKHAVHSHGGYVATQHGSQGSIEALQHFILSK